MEKEFLAAVNTRVRLKYERITEHWACLLKVVPCFCTAHYRVLSVEKVPKQLQNKMKPQDRIILSYPCHNKAYDWMGSTAPWAKQEPDGSIMMGIHSDILMDRGWNVWELNNEGFGFAPEVPQH